MRAKVDDRDAWCYVCARKHLGSECVRCQETHQVKAAWNECKVYGIKIVRIFLESYRIPNMALQMSSVLGWHLWCTTSVNCLCTPYTNGVSQYMGCLLSVAWRLTAKSCGAPESPAHSHRHKTDCPPAFLFENTCRFECDTGYELPEDSTSLLTCILKSESLKWDKLASDCKGNPISSSCKRKKYYWKVACWLRMIFNVDMIYVLYQIHYTAP